MFNQPKVPHTVIQSFPADRLDSSTSLMSIYYKERFRKTLPAATFVCTCSLIFLVLVIIVARTVARYSSGQEHCVLRTPCFCFLAPRDGKRSWAEESCLVMAESTSATVTQVVLTACVRWAKPARVSLQPRREGFAAAGRVVEKLAFASLSFRLALSGLAIRLMRPAAPRVVPIHPNTSA